MRTWFSEHKENPYPTSEEKNELAAKTNLKPSQISLWLVNTRRRYRSKRQQKAATSTAHSSGSQLTSQDSPDDNQQAYLRLQRPFNELNPMDRWKVTPIEQEPAARPVILATVATAPQANFDPYVVHYRYQVGHHPNDLQSGTCLSYHDSSFWGDSMASYETGMPSMFSGSSISDSTAFTNSMLNLAQNPYVARDAARRRRRGQHNKIPKPTSKNRLFQCTFCKDCTFATKHDWQRHEKSQHLSLESWTCCLSGGTIGTTNGPACVFCEHPNPDTLHMETHNYSACQEKDFAERTFYRKDHFQQHLRLTHDSKFHSRMEAWKSEVPEVRSRCGFCNATFTTWSARVDHLASHFKCHATMNDWVGDLGFEPHIAALVERATPNVAEVHPKLTMPSMPPPPNPYNNFANISAGGDFDFLQPLPKHAFPFEAIDGTENISFDMDPTADHAALLNLENIDVADWVNHGV